MRKVKIDKEMAADATRVKKATYLRAVFYTLYFRPKCKHSYLCTDDDEFDCCILKRSRKTIGD